MSDPDFELHLFRTTVRHYEPFVGMEVELVIGGVVVVPGTVTEIQPFILERQQAIGTAKIRWMATYDRKHYSDMVALTFMHPLALRQMGMQHPSAAPPDIHHRRGSNCPACLAASYEGAERTQTLRDELMHQTRERMRRRSETGIPAWIELAVNGMHS